MTTNLYDREEEVNQVFGREIYYEAHKAALLILVSGSNNRSRLLRRLLLLLPLILLVSPRGFEPLTFWSATKRSIR